MCMLPAGSEVICLKCKFDYVASHLKVLQQFLEDKAPFLQLSHTVSQDPVPAHFPSLISYFSNTTLSVVP